MTTTTSNWFVQSSTCFFCFGCVILVPWASLVVSPPPLLLCLDWDWDGDGVDLCSSRRLLVTFSEPEGRCFRGLAGPPVLPQPGPPALSLQPELFLGKPGGAPYFWECRPTGGPGFPGLHGPVAGQYGPSRRGGGWAEETHRRDMWCVRSQ